MIIIIIIITIVLYSAPSRLPTQKRSQSNSLEGREEGDGVINGYVAESDRKPIPGHRASNRKGTAPPSGSP